MLKYIKSFLELIYPEKNICQICDSYDESIGDTYICKGCFSKIERIGEPVCRICNKSLSYNPDLIVCNECAREPRNFEMSRSLFAYKGIIKKIIHDYKYCNKTYYYKLFSHLLIQYMSESRFINFDYITAVPLHKIKQRKRGFNQSELLARQIGKYFKITYIDSLKRNNNTEKQSNLSRYARQKNLQNVFDIASKKIPPLLNGADILIIDDIFTTGTTVNECSKILKSYGANRVFVLTLVR
jgi:competence protein ComFC